MSLKNAIFEIAEYSNQLDAILEKVDVLTDDIAELFFRRNNLQTEWGRSCVEREITIFRIKTDVLQSYVNDAVMLSKRLNELSEKTHQEAQSSE